MKDIVEFIVKQFVSNPDAVEVNEEERDGFVNISLKVAPEDMGLTIGKSGQTIKAIRRLLTIKAIAENVRVNLELIDSGAPKQESEQSDDSKESEVKEEAAEAESEKVAEKDSETETEDKDEKTEDAS